MSLNLIEGRVRGSSKLIRKKSVDGNCAKFLNRTALTSILIGTLMGSLS